MQALNWLERKIFLSILQKLISLGYVQQIMYETVKMQKDTFNEDNKYDHRLNLRMALEKAIHAYIH